MFNLKFGPTKICLCLALLIVLHSHWLRASPMPAPKLVPPVCIPCNVTLAVAPVCVFDERDNCIRRYASQCQLEYVACISHKVLTDYSAEYCLMRGFECTEVEGLERWTIFFGHESD